MLGNIDGPGISLGHPMGATGGGMLAVLVWDLHWRRQV
ncbi:hypothetical protein WSS_A25785 [Rhodococcus opacus M213]|uniref:Uncharacterized protein n=1 Tax=Rhodococcus opacus M213 TaxID=1129896 RepID=K8XG91_RHOOP|nr:hypothetical protein WSS_A25785 [Rhodococcus opacus M213]